MENDLKHVADTDLPETLKGICVCRTLLSNYKNAMGYTPFYHNFKNFCDRVWGNYEAREYVSVVNFDVEGFKKIFDELYSKEDKDYINMAISEDYLETWEEDGRYCFSDECIKGNENYDFYEDGPWKDINVHISNESDRKMLDKFFDVDNLTICHALTTETEYLYLPLSYMVQNEESVNDAEIADVCGRILDEYGDMKVMNVPYKNLIRDKSFRKQDDIITHDCMKDEQYVEGMFSPGFELDRICDIMLDAGIMMYGDDIALFVAIINGEYVVYETEDAKTFRKVEI